ncbi:hypothetical protein [Sphingomonas bacterium]|uniref:hypothetical protein n=1 Tax=Sphingomonas bacterium TaxID=1895847 RepID=UPI001575B6A3|nr:hypothetical protein [Sphingomonas bacterium]
MSYRRKVIAAGRFGYVVTGGLLAIPTALISILFVFLSTTAVPGGIAVHWLAVLALTTGMLYLAMRLSRTPAAGVVLAPAQAPALPATVERLRFALVAPPIHEIRQCATMSAGLVQQPRCCGLAASRAVLILGLPIFYGLTTGEVGAVIVHELGHAVAAHNARSGSCMAFAGARPGSVGGCHTAFWPAC